MNAHDNSVLDGCDPDNFYSAPLDTNLRVEHMLRTLESNAQRAAERRLAHCADELFTEDDDNAEGRDLVDDLCECSAPYCGCDTCTVREVIDAAYPYLLAMMLVQARYRRRRFVFRRLLPLTLLTAVAVWFGVSVASAEEGGWAVINPETGVVEQVIVCTDDVCGEGGAWGGVMPDDTGCPGCTLVKQTNQTADGNVAGWASSDDMTVTHDEDTGNFDIVTETTDDDGNSIVIEQTLVPELTATDPGGMDLHTGIVESTTTLTSPVVEEQTVEVEVEESKVGPDPLDVDVLYPDWGEGRLFAYDSVEDAVANHEADVEAALAPAEPEVEPATEPEAEEPVRTQSDTPEPEAEVAEPEPDTLAATLRSLARRVVSFLSSWFGG